MADYESPDEHGAGLLEGKLSALRYSGHNDDPNEVAGMVRKLIPSGVRVLDVGCGTGSVTVIANAGKQNDVFGIEPDEQRAAVARSVGLNVKCGYFDQRYLDDHGRFDVIVFADVLEHVAAPDKIITIAKSGLNPRGHIVISVPNVAHWSVRAALLLGRFDYTEFGLCDSTHLRWFTKKTICDLLSSSGFRVDQICYTAGVKLPVYNSLIFQWIPGKILRQSIRFLRTLIPKLFACQFVLVASISD